jgi:autotransporter-associated beta strand protein
MENLGRGTVAIRSNASQVFISWRILGTEFDNGTTYNLYRGATKIASDLTVSNYTDNITTNDPYSVSANINGVEQPQSPAVSVNSNFYLDLPLQNIGDYYVHLAWVGDLDGDGEYDFVVDRIPNVAGNTPKVEAYKRDGTFLWRADMGPLSLNMDNIEGGAAAISNGMNDGVTVYDLDNDGKAEVIVKTAKGTILGDGTVLTHTDDIGNFVSVLDGLTGSQKARIRLPTDYLADGPLQTQFTIAYLDGINPSIVVKAKNRVGSGNFNYVVAAYHYTSGVLTQLWKFIPSGQWLSEFHQLRIVDVDGDGKDEVCDGAHVLDDNGSFLYGLGYKGVWHGDRFHIGDFDPNRPGLEGYGIQQDNASGLAWYYYDAKDGTILQSQYLPYVADYARGNAGDFDPRYPGFEMWTFTDGVYNVSGKKTSSAIPASYPNLRLWWDGDVLSEMLDGVKFNKWNYTGSYETRMLTASDYGVTYTWRNVPVLYGDIFGDWREEVVYETTDHTKLRIFTTTIPTNVRLYTLAHNPEYRLCLATKGYYQSAQVDFYLGDGMSTPPVPPILTAKTVWKGGLSGNTWDIGTTSNWSVNGTSNTFTQGDSVMFDISGNPNTTIQISGAVSPADIKVISPVNYTFNGTGSITGSTGLVKSGNGILKLDVSCDYTDTTKVEQGIMYVNADLTGSPVTVYWGAAIGGSGKILKSVHLHNGAIIIPGTKSTVDSITFSSGLALSSKATCEFDLTDDSTGLTKPGDKIVVIGDLTISDTAFFKINKIDGTVKAGFYPLISYTGTFTGNLKKVNVSGLFGQKILLKDSINTIWLNVVASRGPGKVTWSGATSNSWDLLTTPNWLLNGNLDIFANSDSVVFNETGSGQSDVNLNGELTISDMVVETSFSNYSFSGSGNIGGTGNITKNGEGTLTIGNITNTYTGKTIINNGTFILGGLNNAGLASSIGASSSTEPSNIVFNNTKIKYLINADTHTDRGITFAGTQDTLEVGTSGRTISLSGILAGTAKLIKTGPGKLYILNNSNTYTGGTVIKQGEILMNDPGGSSDVQAIGTGLVTFEGGILTMGNTSNYTTCNMNFHIPSGSVGTLNTDQRCNYYGSLTGGGTLNLSLPGTIDRTIFFGDWSAFSGTINATGNRFRLSNPNGYANAGFNLGSGVTLYYGIGTTGGGTDAQTLNIGALSGVAGSYLADENWVIGSKNTSSIFSGIISGNSVTKVGSGSLTLSGANTYSGGTTINNGTLIISNTTGSATGTGAVTINTGATLQGFSGSAMAGPVTVKSGAILTGLTTINGALTVNSGATISPGSMFGTITVNNNVTLQDGSKLALDVISESGYSDRLNIPGTNKLKLDGVLEITNQGTAALADGNSFTIFSCSNISGSFDSIVPATPGTGLIWDTTLLRSNGIIRVDDPTSVKKHYLARITIYPNPTSDFIKISLDRNLDMVSITIENLNGQKMISRAAIKSSLEIFNLSSIPSGVYVVKIQSARGFYSQKIIKK